MSRFHRTLADLLEAGQRCATATLIEAAGSSPGKPGHRLIVLDDGSIRFTIGGGPLEAMVIADCREQLASGDNAVKEYRLLPEGDDAVGMVCGGTVRVFIEVHRAVERLVVFGAGHVGREVIRQARGLDLHRVLADDRDETLRGEDIDSQVETVHCPERYAGSLPPVDERCYVVVVTRCHETDREIVARLAATCPAYIGMIGSRRKVATVVSELAARGVPASFLDRLHAPIGLELGARTPGEIAVSILAELVAERSGCEAARGLARAKSSGSSRSHGG